MAPLRLGFPVKILGAKGLKSNDARRWQSDPHLKVTVERFKPLYPITLNYPANKGSAIGLFVEDDVFYGGQVGGATIQLPGALSHCSYT